MLDIVRTLNPKFSISDKIKDKRVHLEHIPKHLGYIRPELLVFQEDLVRRITDVINGVEERIKRNIKRNTVT